MRPFTLPLFIRSKTPLMADRGCISMVAFTFPSAANALTRQVEYWNAVTINSSHFAALGPTKANEVSILTRKPEREGSSY